MDQSVQKNLGSNIKKEYTGAASRIMKLLGAGLLPAEAARAVGVDDSYVSQLQKETSFTEQVSELVKKAFADQSEIDNNYTDIERVLSKKLRQSTEFMQNPDQILRTLRFANEAKRKLAPALTNPGNGGNGDGSSNLRPVTLILPTQIINNFTLSPNNEIVAVGEEQLNTLPSANINNLVKNYKDNLKKTVVPKIELNGPRHSDPYGDL